jgi:fumarate hydratase, class I
MLSPIGEEKGYDMREHFLELLRRASTDLPADVVAALRRGARRERAGSSARSALGDVLCNSELARETSRPICQDTGTNIWYVYHPREIPQWELAREIEAATKQATGKAYLRPNAVHPISGKNSGDNTGLGHPVIHFRQWKRKSLVADVMLKGGGSENVSTQYSLPASEIGAGRDIEGIRRVVIDAVFRAQGKGCGPGVIGVGVGGDRAGSTIEAKEQLLRLIDDRNPDRELDRLERRLLRECNELGIGPMGFGGAATALAVKIGARHRLPASYFVSIAYMCWACRRASLELRGERASFSQVSQIARRYRLPDSSRKKGAAKGKKGGRR